MSRIASETNGVLIFVPLSKLIVDVLAVVHSDNGKSLQRISLDDLMMDCDNDFLEVI